MRRIETEVAIVGAGVAGLATARTLAAHGVSSTVLEANSVIGGRIRTLRRPDWALPIELGAEFMHGRPATTLALLGESPGLLKVPEKRARVGAVIEAMPNTWQRFAALVGPASEASPSQSVHQYLQERNPKPEDAALVRSIVEGYDAAPLDDISAKSVGTDAKEAGADFEQYRLEAGQDSIIARLEHGIRQGAGHIELGARVTSIDWAPAGVTLEVTTPAEELLVSARRCVLTVSIGVLQTPGVDGGIELRPFPSALKSAIFSLGMGDVVKVVLRFERAPWPRAPVAADATFLHAPEAAFPTIWRERRDGQEQVTLWAGGPPASALRGQSTHELDSLALRCLAEVSGESSLDCRRQLIEAHHHDFTRDPLTRGAYSYVRAGAVEPWRLLAEPLGETLFFAGEAFDIEYATTVAGALGSGERAARRILTLHRER
jgi:monoamine oxidase